LKNNKILESQIYKLEKFMSVLSQHIASSKIYYFVAREGGAVM